MTHLSFRGALTPRGESTVRATVTRTVAEAPFGIVAGLSQVDLVSAACTLPAGLDAQADRAAPPVELHWYGLPDAITAARVHRTPEAALAAAAPPPGRLIRLPLPPDFMTTPATARLAVGDACTDWGRRDLVHSARLVISELVSNAIRHAGTDLEVTVALRGDYLYLAVRDGSPRVPILRPPAEHPGTGRIVDPTGLGLVDQVALRWSTTAADTGKIVWAILPPWKPDPR